MSKQRSSTCLLLICILVMLSIFAAFFALFEFPAATRDVRNPPELANVDKQTGSHEPIEDIVKGFYQRTKKLAPQPWPYEHSGLRKDFFEIAHACLLETESDDTLVMLLTYPNHDVRTTAVRALGDAMNMQGANGHAAIISLTDRVEAKREGIERSLLETLIDDTEEGIEGHAPYLLLKMGSGSPVTLATLRWSSDNHQSADMRVWTMNALWLLADESEEAQELLFRNIFDRSGEVRSQALQSTLLSLLERAAAAF